VGGRGWGGEKLGLHGSKRTWGSLLFCFAHGCSEPSRRWPHSSAAERRHHKAWGVSPRNLAAPKFHDNLLSVSSPGGATCEHLSRERERSGVAPLGLGGFGCRRIPRLTPRAIRCRPTSGAQRTNADGTAYRLLPTAYGPMTKDHRSTRCEKTTCRRIMSVDARHVGQDLTID
jgi:hypothetical protein